jgi:hypothetical protein
MLFFEPEKGSFFPTHREGELPLFRKEIVPRTFNEVALFCEYCGTRLTQLCRTWDEGDWYVTGTCPNDYGGTCYFEFQEYKGDPNTLPERW